MQVSPDEAKDAIACDNLCKHLGAAIFKAYPSRRWYVEVKNSGQSAIIKIPELSMEWGSYCHMDGNLENNTRKAVKFAGELLERFNLTRGSSDNSDLMSLPRNYKGVVGASKGEL